MDAARQVVRWSIPGGVFAGAFGFFRLLHRSLGGVDPLIEPELLNVASVLLALVVSIPLGFLVYQAYYVTYYFGIPGIGVPLDRGADVLNRLSPEQREEIQTSLALASPLKTDVAHRKGLLWRFIPVKRLDRKALTPNTYRERRFENMAIIRAWLDAVVSPIASEVKATYTSLSDIYHAQGAARVAVILAWLADVAWFALLAIRGEKHLAPIAFLPITVLMASLVSVLTLVRSNLWRDMQATVAHGISAAWSGRAPGTRASQPPDVTH